MDAKGYQKEALFKELRQLEESESDGEDISLGAFTKRKAAGQSTKLASNTLRPSRYYSRKVSNPLQLLPALQPEDVNAIGRTPRVLTIDKKLATTNDAMTPRGTPTGRSFTTGAEATKRRTAKTGTKRKRGESLELLPESQKIFTGLSFCNNSVPCVH